MTTVHCPNCQAPVAWTSESPYRPFCSKRCKLIDLGAWVDGSNHIPGQELNADDLDRIDVRDDPANE